MIDVSVTGRFLIEFSSDTPFGRLVKFRWVSRIPYTGCTVFLFSIRGALAAAGESEISPFSIDIVVCIVSIFWIFVGLVYCRNLPAIHNSFSVFFESAQSVYLH